jgi:hypothetical protein
MPNSTTYQLKKISRGEYQVIRPDGREYFPFPVSKHKAEQSIITEKVHARFLVHVGIRKAALTLLERREIKIDHFSSVDTFIYQYSYQLDHVAMRDMMQRPVLFVHHIDNRMASDRAAREASIPPPPVDSLTEAVHALQIDVARLKQQVEYLNNRLAGV